MSNQLPEGLQQLLSSQEPSGPGQPLPAGLQDYDQDETDPLKVLQECIQGLPKVIAALPDPQDTQDAIQALHILARIQTRLSGRANGPAAQGR